MKFLGYFFVAYAVVLGVMVCFDQFLANPEQIWAFMNWISLGSLIVCVILGVRYHLSQSGAIAPDVLLSIAALVLFAESFIAHDWGEAMGMVNWLWVDVAVIIALLRVGTNLLSSDAVSASEE